MRSKVLLASGAVATLLGSLLFASMVFAQAQQSGQQKETIARPPSARQKRGAENRLRKELESPFKRWLDEEVRWIISDEERTAFSRLETDEERQEFIEQFWLRRDPSPDTEENEFREEHYRRIAWANDRFASGIPGWKTDRGMIYIKFGAPDERDEHPTGGPGQRDLEEGGGQTTFFPYERWRYRYLDGVGQDITLEFVDKSMTNEYRLTWDPSEKDALLRVPGAGLTLYEQLGLANKIDRFNNTSAMNLGQGPMSGTAKMNVFDRLQQFTNVQKAPPIKFKDLEAAVNSTIKYNLLPMQVRVDYIPVTEVSVITLVTMQWDRGDLQFREKEGWSEAIINVHASITTMTRRPIGRAIEPIVSLRYLPEQLGQAINGVAIHQEKIPLLPGRYRLSIAAKDVVGGNMSTYDVALDVPRVEEDRLATSSLIMADQIEKVSTRSIDQGPYIIGSTKVRPRIDNTFKRNEKLGIYLQVYNFETDEGSRKPDGEISYEIVRNGSNQKVLEFTESVANLQGGASQMIIEKQLRLDGFEPGDYTLQLRVTDKLRNESLTPSATFKVI